MIYKNSKQLFSCGLFQAQRIIKWRIVMPDIATIGAVAEIASQGFNAASSGIVTTILNRMYLPKQRAVDYLYQQAKEHDLTEEDYMRAASIYGAHKDHQRFIRLYKITSKADQLLKNTSVEPDATIEEDWFATFEDFATKFTDDRLLNMWAAILAGETKCNGTYRKIMLHRLALLDLPAVKAFTELCKRTYTLNVSDGQSFQIPFCIGDVEISEMNRFEDSKLTVEEEHSYRNGLPSYSETQILEEIGLISQGDDFNDTDIPAESKLNFEITINDSKLYPFSIRRKNSEYYLTTFNGSTAYTHIGLQLYNVLCKEYKTEDFIKPVVEKYNSYIANASAEQFKRDRNLFRFITDKTKKYVFLD